MTDSAPSPDRATDDALPDAAKRPPGSRDEAGHGRWTRARPWIGRIIWLTGLCVAALLVWLTLRRYSLGEMAAAMTSVPAGSIVTALAFAAASYLCLTLSDAIGLRYLGRSIPYRSVALASFVSLSIGHNIGMSGLSSGALRYRFYKRHGLGLAEIARLMLMCGITVAIGLAAVAAVSLIMRPDLAGRLVNSTAIGRGLALASVAVVVGYWLLAWRFGGQAIAWRWKLEIPTLRAALQQTTVGAANFALVSGCLFALVRTAGDVAYLDVAAVFVIANVATLVTHVPGGVGVIESIVILLLPGEAVVGPVLLFRIVYFLVPLALGSTLLAVSELAARRERGADTDAGAAAIPARTAPRDRGTVSRRQNEPARG